MERPTTEAGSWQLAIDTGGTFTDCLARDPSGELHRAKVLSSGTLRGRLVERRGASSWRIEQRWSGDPAALRGMRVALLEGAQAGSTGEPARITSFDPVASTLALDRALDVEPSALPCSFEASVAEEAPLLAARVVTGTPAGEPLPAAALRVATTRGTNALLERRGARCALLVTRGFADVLRIGTQARPDIFALDIRRPPPLHEQVVEVDERLAADGSVLRPLDERAVADSARHLRDAGIDVAAVALAHSYRNPAHEQRVAGLLGEAGFRYVRTSASLSPLINLLQRAETALVDAYLSPLIDRFVASIDESLAAGSTLLVMTSAGGLVRADAYRAKDSLLSGPAGGVVGAAEAARLSGFDQVLTFDMGGTSTDVARYGGRYDYRFAQRVGGALLQATALSIETVAAGGGSICRCEEGRLQVGPQSAGASPGPACYGAGGPLTITDVNLLLGRLDPERFGIPVQREPAERALERLREQLVAQSDRRPSRDELLEGLVAIADQRMADAIRKVSVARGYDPAEHALVAFGGAGPQHACGVARLLGIETVIIPPDAGLLSALGLSCAEVERIVTRQLLERLDELGEQLEQVVDEMEREACRLVSGDADGEATRVRRRIANLRSLGQDTTLSIDFDEPSQLAHRFAERYREVYGHAPEKRPIELESLRVIAASASEGGASSDPALPPPSSTEPILESSTRRVEVLLDGERRRVACYQRAQLPPRSRLPTPALVIDRHATTVIPTGWKARVDEQGALVLDVEQGGAREGPEVGPAARAVRLELFANRLMTIAEETGEMLRRTALSTNVKERLDFSCALLDVQGRLVVNAPHIPVHLGSLGLCVRSVIRALPLGSDDVAVANHPAYGGSHLPDVTVITPVDAGGVRLGYVASRAHHAEIGGCRPGSMPPHGRHLADEGVVIAPRLLVEGGEPRWEQMRDLLGSGPWPSRAVDENIADLRAAVAANRYGADALRRLADATSAEAVTRHMRELEQLAERRIREALGALDAGEHRATATLDDGTPLAVCVTIHAGGGAAERGARAERVASGRPAATFDFSESGDVHPGNLNATEAIVRSAVLYVLRLLVDRPLPLNEGMMSAVDVQLASGLLDPPFCGDPQRDPAVVGGNVETSQRLVDLLLEALQLAANSQGTMNNVLFGNERFGYYETIGGGAGAGPTFDGASGVHCHMTNTRITDIEVLEHRYPVRLERFALRAGSGGAGRHRGGDGIVRELCFVEPLELSLLTQRRAEGPRGLGGGSAGAPGRQILIRASGQRVELDAIDGCTVQPGDRLVIETPGGGGWGPAD